MPSTEQLDVKVIYSSSSRGRRRPGPHASRSLRPSRLIVVGLLNLAAAGALYFGTWQWADPELRLRVFLHVPLPGVELDQVAEALFPGLGPAQAPKRTPRVTPAARKAERTKATTAQALGFVGTAVGWEILTSLAAGALALSGGTLLGRSGGSRLRIAALAVALVGLGVVGWQAYALWGRYGRFVPDQFRIDILGGLVLLALSGLVIRAGARRLTFLAAILLITSAVGSVVALLVGAHYEAITPAELPMSVAATAGLVFVAQSLWGWLLLPVASRIS